MTDIKRLSPVAFNKQPIKTQVRDNWVIALEYDDEGDGPWITDLSHVTKWDVQASDIAEQKPCDISIPDTPGKSKLENGVLINRMNRTQASVWHISGDAPEIPEASAYTDTTESTMCLALFGKDVFFITEKLSALDFQDPEKESLFLLQGPFSHVPCQIVTLKKSDANSGIIFTCSRGYGHDMVHAIMDAGAEFDLRPAGENMFKRWIEDQT
ncbi:sarcosine oxidase subunit gamma SoxG [Desulfobacterales bacterium HSG17]|nr:sarcosine oxidase subunit gamma SoxG [Desulfobacterales bacterium HSG17]